MEPEPQPPEPQPPGSEPPNHQPLGEIARDLELLAEPARQSPVAMLQWLIVRLRRIGAFNLVVAAGVLFSRQIPGWLLPLFPVAGLLVIAVAVVAWWRLTFWATESELVVASGVVSQQTLRIPFSKVQSVSVEETLTQRMFGLVSASVDTAGAIEAEFSIHGISREQAEALGRLSSRARSMMLADSASSPPGVEPVPMGAPPIAPPLAGSPPAPTQYPPEVLATRSAKELIQIGMLANPLGGIALLGAAAFFADDLLRYVGLSIPNAESLSPYVSGLSRLAFAGAMALLFSLSWFVVGLQSMLRYWDMKLSVNQDGLELTSGLLKRTSQSSGLNKVQLIHVRYGPLLNKLGFYELKLLTIGAGDFAVPGVNSAELARIRSVVQLPFAAPLSRKVSSHLVIQRVRLAALAMVPLALMLGALNYRFLPVVMVPIALAAVAGFVAYKNLRWDVTDRSQRSLAQQRTIARRSGRWFVHEVAMSADKAQSVTVSQSFYQRRRGLSSITIKNAGASFTVPMLPLSESKALRDLLLS